jgi:hypothetical protein
MTLPCEPPSGATASSASEDASSAGDGVCESRPTRSPAPPFDHAASAASAKAQTNPVAIENLQVVFMTGTSRTAVSE